MINPREINLSELKWQPGPKQTVAGVKAAVSTDNAVVTYSMLKVLQAGGNAIDAAIARANSRLPEYAHIARWARFPETPTFAAGLATANGRLRRDSILQRFGAFIESLYTEEPPCHAIP